MNRKTSIIMGIIAVVIISMISGGIVASGVLDPYEKQIKLGYKMISQEKYEEAILAFDKAIEIDQKKEKAYIGLSDTYVARCDENTVKDANDALTRGYEQYQSEKIVDSYIESAQKLYDKDKKDWAIELLEKGYKETNSAVIKGEKAELIDYINKEFLKNLFELCETNNFDQVKEITKSGEFTNVSDYANSESPLIYSPESTKSNKNGKGIGIYNSGGDIHIYFGDYVNNLRCGNGKWISVNWGDYYCDYIFEGNWSNDLPNGMGKATNHGETMSGELINGLWNGEVLIQDPDDGYVTAHFNEGIVTIIGEKDDHGYYSVGEGTKIDGGEYSLGIREEDIKRNIGIDGFADVTL